MIDNLVFQNAAKPASLRGTAAEFFVATHIREKCLLDEVFGHFGFADAHESVLVEALAVVVDPAVCSRGRLSFALGHGAEFIRPALILTMLRRRSRHEPYKYYDRYPHGPASNKCDNLAGRLSPYGISGVVRNFCGARRICKTATP